MREGQAVTRYGVMVSSDVATARHFAIGWTVATMMYVAVMAVAVGSDAFAAALVVGAIAVAHAAFAAHALATWRSMAGDER